ncbi:TetR/AcrR family transcriptional regulator [Qaidamihabitans albus]|uniref:TetR/AcrR family transcriptional regulator n=1 Tax=Qaidamihabitans albus TaxID=2795733 RepID=UPI0018F25A78|nr:TetR/AcrR family transcriptional regulator [Qaidamihabitans albus]
MPKRVDHEERRHLIAEAVRRIAADRGLEAVSLGEVAAEAGISKGLVQHYFPSKDTMLRHATTTLRHHVEDRMSTAPADLRTTLVALFPLDDAGRTEALVANAFLVRALKDPEIADRFRTGHAQLRDAVATLIANEQATGALPADLDPAREADLLLALVSGLGDAVLLGHRTPAEAEALIDHYLSRLAHQPGEHPHPDG